jgi:hypothetical protein
MHEAFGSLLMENPEMLDVYVTGARQGHILGNVCCGKITEGARVNVPPRLYEKLATRLRQFAELDDESFRRVLWFCAYRVNPAFLGVLHKAWPVLQERSLSFGRMLSAYRSQLKILVGMHQAGVLDEPQRAAAVLRLVDLAVEPDGGFDVALALFTPDEEEELADALRNEVLLQVESLIDVEVDNFDKHGRVSPEDHMEGIRDAFSCMEAFFARRDDAQTAQGFHAGWDRVLEAQQDLDWPGRYDDYDPDSVRRSAAAAVSSSPERDRFDDIDE